jgi:hypothetical protein
VTSRPETSPSPDMSPSGLSLAWPMLFMFGRTPTEETGLPGQTRLASGGIDPRERRRMEVRHDAQH